MEFELNAVTIIRTVIYAALAVTAFFVLVRVLNFFTGLILGFVVTLLLVYWYFR